MTNMNEQYVIDLSWLEANFRHKTDGKERLVLKIWDEAYLLITRNGALFTTDPGILDFVEPTPTAPPHKFVILETVTGEKVRCEFKATHNGEIDGIPYGMVFEGNYDDGCGKIHDVCINKYGTIAVAGQFSIAPIKPTPTPKVQLLAELDAAIEQCCNKQSREMETLTKVRQLAELMSDG